MADIKAFLLPPVMDETKEVVITKRAVDENGKPVPFVIRVIDQATNNRLLKQATKKNRSNGRAVQELDTDLYGKLLVGACVVQPNFKDAELCAYYKTVDPLEVPGRMLTMGEYNLLVRKIRELNDIVDNDEDLEDIEEEAKKLIAENTVDVQLMQRMLCDHGIFPHEVMNLPLRERLLMSALITKESKELEAMRKGGAV